MQKYDIFNQERSDIMASNYSNSLYKDYEKLEKKYKELEKKYKFEKLRADVAEYENQRFEIINNKINELTKKLNMTEYERNQYLAKLNIDGTNAGIPTSQTPINKKKLIPNSRKNTGGKIGGKLNHPKYKLEKFNDKEINENEDITLDECPECGSKELIELNSEITKDEFDYQVKIIKNVIILKNINVQIVIK